MRFYTSLSMTLATMFAFTASVPIQSRQIGGGPSEAPIGMGWSRTWRDETIREPRNFSAKSSGSCTVDISFERDTQDDKFELKYIAYYGQGEGTVKQEKPVSTLEYVGAKSSDGFQTYLATLPDACADDWGERPGYFEVYFTPEPEAGERMGYYSEEIFA